MAEAHPAPPVVPSTGGAAAGGGVITYAASAHATFPAGPPASPAASQRPGALAALTPVAAGSHAPAVMPPNGSHAQPNPVVAMTPGPSPTSRGGATAMAYAPIRQPGTVGTSGSAALYSATPAALPAGATPPSGPTAIATLTGGAPLLSGGTYILSQSSGLGATIASGTTGTGDTLAGPSSGSPTATKPVTSPWAGLLSITSNGLGKPPALSFLNPNDPSVPTLPGGQTFLGVWSVPPGDLAAAPLTLSYDRQLLTDLGQDPSQVSLWAYNGKWSLVSGPGTADTATVNNPTDIQLFAAGTPEPAGAAVGTVVGLLLLMRRRRRNRI
jgi:hypothetical protein